jgi:hypothetical protein
MWEKKRSRFKKKNQYYYSIANKLKKENKINEEFEIMLSSLTLEDIIGLKLELSAKTVNYDLYGINIWRTLPDIIKSAVLNYAYSAGRTKSEMAFFLGLDLSRFKKLLKKYNVTNYFSNPKEIQR